MTEFSLWTTVCLGVRGLYSIFLWFSESGLNIFQNWLPATSNTIAKTLCAPSALFLLALWSKQCNQRQDYKECNVHKPPRESKLWQTRLFRSLWFPNHPDCWRDEDEEMKVSSCFLSSVVESTLWLLSHVIAEEEDWDFWGTAHQHSSSFQISHS